MTGGNELRKSSLGGSLGGASLEPRKLTPREISTFSDRVYDGAVNATAELVIMLGGHRVVIHRELKDLSLHELSIDSEAQECKEKNFSGTFKLT